MHAPVVVLALGDERLPIRVEGIHLEPSGDGHAAGLKRKIIWRTPGDFHELIIAIEFDRFPETGLPIHERDRRRPSLSAMKHAD